jgi:hypothetical protein
VRRSSFSFSGTKARACLAAAAVVASTMVHRVPAEPPSASRFTELLGKEDVTGEQILREMNSRKATNQAKKDLLQPLINRKGAWHRAVSQQHAKLLQQFVLQH